MNIRRIQAITYTAFAGAMLGLLSCDPIPAHAQQAPAPHPATATAPKPPTLTDAQKAAYWKAVAQLSGLQKQVDSASTAVQQSVQALVAACGSDATLQQAPNGDPECVAKVEPKK